MTPELEDERRAKLRNLLVHCRSRLQPNDVGLPESGRRRVVGLRREEVAELAGVSSDWYRWFESGSRCIHVSVQFVARLADALRMTPAERRALFRLALPELYQTHVLQPAWADSSLLTPVASLDEVPRVLREVALARDAVLAHETPLEGAVRPRILRSWHRSIALGVDPTLKGVPPAAASEKELAARRDANCALLQAAAPTLASLRRMCEGTGYAIVLADAKACILEMSGERRILDALSKIKFEPGQDLREEACGTNAIGTAIVDDRPLQVLGAENFAEAGSNLTCTAAPIHDPITRQIVGVLDVTADCRLIEPRMIAIIDQAALEIEERLASAPPAYATAVAT